MPYIKLSRNAFVRQFEDIGVIINQRNRSNLVFDEIGAMFLKHLPRVPQVTDSIVAKLSSEFIDISPQELFQDFNAFVGDLEQEGFVITGDNAADVELRDSALHAALPPGFLKSDQGINVADSDQFLQRHFVKHPRLFGLQIEVSGCCNENCLHCYFPWESMHSRPQLCTPTILDVLDQVVSMGTFEVTFTGGEPLLNQDLPVLLQRARKNDLSISVLTNAVLFTDETAPMFREFNVGAAQVSIYSMDETIHETITRLPGSWRRTIRAVEQLLAAGVPVQVGCPVMRENLLTFGDVLQWGQELGIKVDPNLIIMAKTNMDRANLSHRLTLDECEEAMKTIFRYDTRYHSVLSDLKLRSRPRDPELPICGIGTYMMCLGANGDFYPCPGFAFTLGNVSRQSVREVWDNSPRICELRSVRSGHYPLCLACDSWDFCPPCVSRHYSETGSLLALSEHVCSVTHLNRRMAMKWREEHAAMTLD